MLSLIAYQVQKIAEIFLVNQQGALEKHLDPGRLAWIPEPEVLLQEQGQQTVALYPSETCCFHCWRECHLGGNNCIICKEKNFLRKPYLYL